MLWPYLRSSPQQAAALCLALMACCLLGACDLVPGAGERQAFPTATALSRNLAGGGPGADNARDSSLVTPAAGRTGGRSTIPPLLTPTPTPTATITPGTPLPTGTPTITLTPFATPTRYRTATQVPAPPTVTPLAGGQGLPATPTSRPRPPAPANTNTPGSRPPNPGPQPASPIVVDVGETASRNGMAFVVTRVDKSARRVDVIYRLTNQTGSAIAFTMTNTDQRVVRGGTAKGPADPGGIASITLQNGQSYDSGTTFFISGDSQNGDDLVFAIDNLPGIGSVQVRIP